MTHNINLSYIKLWNLFNFLDAPAKPEGPVELSNITKDSVTLAWQPPSKDGGTPLTGYIIEQRDKRRTQWTKAGSVDKDTTTFVASKLLEDNEYVFRVTAVNAEGESEPLESTDVAKPKQPLCKYIFACSLQSTLKFQCFFI